MKTKKSKFLTNLTLLSFIVALVSIGWTGDVQNGGGKRLNKPNEVAEFTIFNINNVRIPLDNKGVIGDVDPGDGLGAGGTFANIVFLFSGGFYLSGYDNGQLWGNGVLSASRIEDYQPGPVGSSQNDSKNKVYIVRVQDRAFGDSWQEWRDAVSIGADYYDGDGDGAYNPVDLNGNGTWEANEDRPDLIGDWTAWCVYNDGIAAALKRFTAVPPKGIEIHQTVFGFASRGVVGNMMFVRYRLVNSGTKAEVFDNVFFSAAVDPDMGDSGDDLVGCDTTLSAGFVFNDGDDPEYGAAPPAFLMDFFQGPIVYQPGITFEDVDGNGEFNESLGDVPLDTAYNVGGRVKGIKTFPGATNLPLSSFSQYMQSHPTHGDPNTHIELRNYMIGGKGKNGDSLYVSTWTFGNGATLGADTSRIPAHYMYSGDPVTRRGWLNTAPIDQRQMSNTGPFTLRQGVPVDIYVVYVLGRGDNALQSLSIAKDYDITAQLVFDNNFPSPPPPPAITYDVVTGDGFIDITFETAPQVSYRAIDNVLDIDRQFQGYYVSQYLTNVKAASIGSVDNEAEIASYGLNNFIKNIYVREGNGGVVLKRALPDNLLDSTIFKDPESGRIRIRITEDPFTNGPLIKGKEYYFALGNYTLNHRVIVNRTTNTYGPEGDYLDPTNGAYEEFETALITVEYGTNMYSPQVLGAAGSQTTGASQGAVNYVVIDKTRLTGNNYAVEFFKDSASTLYSTYHRLVNKTTGVKMFDSSKVFNYDFSDYSGKIQDGFIVKVRESVPTIMTFADQQASYTPQANVWFTDFAFAFNTGAYYVGSDIANADGDEVLHPLWPSLTSKVIKIDDLRKIEIRFDNSGKAYRYLHGFIGNSFLQRNQSYIYAGGVTDADTVNDGKGGRGEIGKFGEGFVDVPFTAWLYDERYGSTAPVQLACGFLERSGESRFKGNPDGKWDPGIDVKISGEVIFVFNAHYDATGSQKFLTGGDFSGTTVWGDVIKGFTIPAAETGVTAEEKVIAKSPFFNSMYVISLQRRDSTTFFTPGDKFNVGLGNYPYTDKDVYSFTTAAGGQLSEADKQSIFDKVNVYPNPLFAFNPATSYSNGNPDDPFVTFTNLPTEVNVKIYSLSGMLIKTLTEQDKLGSTSSPFLRWNLKNENSLRVASGMYIALITSPQYGEKTLKFAIIQPQKQLQKY
ncbi:MAG: T9SS type A sorting domain-containing protein [bacterium]